MAVGLVLVFCVCSKAFKFKLIGQCRIKNYTVHFIVNVFEVVTVTQSYEISRVCESVWMTTLAGNLTVRRSSK